MFFVWYVVFLWMVNVVGFLVLLKIMWFVCILLYFIVWKLLKEWDYGF